MSPTLALTLALIACSGDTDEATGEDVASEPPRKEAKKRKAKAITVKVDSAFDEVRVTCCGHSRVDDVLSEYLDIQRSLAADTVTPGDAYALYGHARSIVDQGMVSGDALEAVKEMVAAAAAIKDTDLEGTRAGFDELSAAMQGIVEARAGQGSTEIALAHCPMEKGGIWYQAESELKNPYYGSEMLSCGAFKKQ